MQKKLALLLTLTALVLALAACGGNKNNDTQSESPAGSPAAETASQEVVINATSWKFDKEQYDLPKDTPVKLTLNNTKGAHGIEIVGQNIEFHGNNSEIVTLPAGTYEIHCSIMCGTGHKQMISKLVVS